MAESSTDILTSLANFIDSKLLDVNTAIEGRVLSYSNGRATVKPVGQKRFADGDVLDYPVIPDVRVCWPAFDGGSAGVKGPVKAGDKCLIVISQQAADGTDDRRMFDIQDSYAIMCDVGNAGSGDSGNNDDMTMYYNSAYFRITKEGKVIIFAPAGVEIKTPKTLNTGTLTTEGLFKYQSGMTGFGGGAGTTISGNLNHVAGSITSLGRTIDGTHVHDETGNVTSPPR